MKKPHWAAKLSTVIGALSLSLSGAASADVLSGPTPVNILTYGPQSLWAASSGINGDSLLTWADSRLGISGLRRFDGTGLALDSGDWYMDSGFNQAAFDKFGNFAIAGMRPDGSGKSIFVTMFNRNGTTRYGKFRVNATPSERVDIGTLSFNSSGKMLVYWAATLPDNTHRLYARTYDMAAGLITSGIIAITPPSMDTMLQDARIDDNGNFVVIWALATPTSDVYYQRFSNNGTPLTNPIVVNTYQAGTQRYASLGMNGAGNSVVVWESYNQNGERAGVYAQRFNSTGAKLGAEFRVNDTALQAQSQNQNYSSATMTEEGNFAVSWVVDNRSNDPSSTTSTYLKQYFANGTAYGPEKKVYTSPAGTFTFGTRLTTTPAGVATLGLRNYSAANDYDVVAIRYLLDTQPAVTSLNSGVAVTGISSPQFGQRLFKIDVPSGKSILNISVSGPGVGNADLYGKLGAIPSLSNYEFRSVNAGNAENVSISNIPPGSFYFSLYGAAAYSGVTLKVTYQ